MADEKLTLAAQIAIRSYFFKIAAPTGAVLTAVAFLLGFFINEAARGSAYSNAYADAFGDIIETLNSQATNIAVFEQAADRILVDGREKINELVTVMDDASNRRNRLGKLVEEADMSLVQIREIVADFETQVSTEDLADRLVKNASFGQSLSAQLDTRSDELLTQLEAVKSELENLKSEVPSFIKSGDGVSLRSAAGNLNPRGGSRAEKQVTLTGNPGPLWTISR